jgi:undecaprenyl diphosphate synthase
MADTPRQTSGESTAAAGMPRHVAIIMDGNGRWAQQRRRPRAMGHRAGAETVRRIVDACGRRGISVLTLFAFSSENWRRPKTEVSMLMDLFMRTLEKEVRRLHRHKVQLRFIGDLSAFSDALQERMRSAVELTAGNQGMILQIAVNYGGRWDIAQALRKLAVRVSNGELEAGSLDIGQIESELSTAGLPEPDLFIRTGGERRISNFLLWQLAYTELYFTEVLWPDFSVEEFDRALEWFAGRQRRFGRTGEQVEQGLGGQHD